MQIGNALSRPELAIPAPQQPDTRALGRKAAMEVAQRGAADEIAREKMEISTALNTARTVANPAQWDQVMQSLGQAELVGKFAARDMVLPYLEGADEVLTQVGGKAMHAQAPNPYNPARPNGAPRGNPGYGGLPQRGPAPPVDEALMGAAQMPSQPLPAPPPQDSLAGRRLPRPPVDEALMGAAQMPSPREFERQPRKQVHNQAIHGFDTEENRAVGSARQGEAFVVDPASPTGFIAQEIPGGALAQEREAEQEREASRSLYSDVYGDAVIDNIARVRQLAEDTRFTNGLIGGWTQNIGGTNANDMRALITPIESAIGLDRLASMREQSATGASGMGALNEQELNLLVNGMYSLDQSQSEAQFLENLDRIQQSLTILRFGPPPEGVERAEWARLIEAMTPTERTLFE